MLEFFAYKKFKKHKEEKKAEEEAAKSGDETRPDTAADTAAAGRSNTLKEKQQDHAVLEESDQAFIERILAQADDQAPPLPPRVKTPDVSWDSRSESSVRVSVSRASKDGKGKGEEEEKEEKKKHRFSFIPNPMHHFKSSSKSHSSTSSKPGEASQNLLQPVAPITDKEAERESADLSSILSKFNLAAGRGNKAISLSPDTTELVSKFTNVFKDLMNGVPTAYDDLMSLIDDHDGVLSRNYEKLPSSLKELITTLPTKLTSTLAPELLAVAAEAQGLDGPTGAAGKKELKDAAKSFLTPSSVEDLVTKPGAVVGMLKGIVNALKLRWPAFMGTNVVWAVAISILMFVLWYCHKRGREVRLEKEKSDAATAGVAEVKDEDRIEELPDDPALPAPPAPAVPWAATAKEPAGPSVKVTGPGK